MPLSRRRVERIFSPFLDLTVDPDLYSPDIRALIARCPAPSSSFRIITSLLLPSPEEAWEPYCSRRPFSTLSRFFPLSVRRHPLAPPYFYSRPASPSILSSSFPPLRFSISTGWHTMCRARAITIYVIRWKSLACRK